MLFRERAPFLDGVQVQFCFPIAILRHPLQHGEPYMSRFVNDGGLIRAAKYGNEILGRVISAQVPVAALVEIRIGMLV